MILVTGSTGHLGQLTIDNLLTRTSADNIIAGARSPEKASAFAAKGVQVRELDYEKPETIAAALKGVTHVALISSSTVGSRFAHHKAVIDAAKEAGIQLTYTSVLHANPAMALAADHIETEKYLADSGLTYTVLRNGWYHENYLSGLEAAVQHGVLLGAAGDGALTPASRNDFAEALAVVVTSNGHAGKVYELGGDTSYTLPQLAATIAEVSGKPVKYQDLPAEEYAKTLEGYGMPPNFAAVLADCDVAIRDGVLLDTSGDLSRLIGRPTTPFADVVREALA